MVQIIPARPSPGEMLAKGLSSGIASGGDLLTKLLLGKEQAKQKGSLAEKQFAQELIKLKAGEELRGEREEKLARLKEGLKGERQKEIFELFLGGGDPSALRESVDIDTGLDDLDPSELPRTPSVDVDSQYDNLMQKSKGAAALGNLGLANTFSKQAGELKKDEREYLKQDIRHFDAFEKEIADIDNQLNATDISMEILKEGIGKQTPFDTIMGTAARILNLEGLETKTSAQIATGVKETFVSGLKGVSAKGLNQFLEKTLKAALVSPEKFPEVNKIVFESMEAFQEMKRAKSNAFHAIVDRYERQGKRPPKNIRQLVNKEVEREHKNIMDRRAKRIQEILEEKKSDHNILHGIDVTATTPVTQKAIDLFEKRNNYDPEKTVKSMKKAGYNVI